MLGYKIGAVHQKRSPRPEIIFIRKMAMRASVDAASLRMMPALNGHSGTSLILLS